MKGQKACSPYASKNECPMKGRAMRHPQAQCIKQGPMSTRLPENPRTTRIAHTTVADLFDLNKQSL